MNARKTLTSASTATAGPHPARARQQCRKPAAAASSRPPDRPRAASPRRLPALPWPGPDPLFDSLRAELGL